MRALTAFLSALLLVGVAETAQAFYCAFRALGGAACLPSLMTDGLLFWTAVVTLALVLLAWDYWTWAE